MQRERIDPSLEVVYTCNLRANKALNMLINLPWSNGMCIVDFCLDILHSDMYKHNKIREGDRCIN